MKVFFVMGSRRAAAGSHGGGPFARSGGWSLVELLVSCSIIAVLLSLVVSAGWKKMLHRAERTSCESNLKSLHGALTTYMTDHDQWPQLPQEYFEGFGDEDQYMGWWFNELKPYQITEAQWLCPTDRRERNANTKREERGKHESSYGITPFGPGPNEPRQFNTPWVVERSDFHGGGNLMIMPDGSIQTSPWINF